MKSSPQIELLRREHPNLMTERDVAEKVGRSHSTIKRWRNRGLLTPTFYRDLGSIRVWLYNNDDLAQATQLAAEIKRGRKRASPEENKPAA